MFGLNAALASALGGGKSSAAANDSADATDPPTTTSTDSDPVEHTGSAAVESSGTSIGLPGGNGAATNALSVVKKVVFKNNADRIQRQADDASDSNDDDDEEEDSDDETDSSHCSDTSSDDAEATDEEAEEAVVSEARDRLELPMKTIDEDDEKQAADDATDSDDTDVEVDAVPPTQAPPTRPPQWTSQTTVQLLMKQLVMHFQQPQHLQGRDGDLSVKTMAPLKPVGHIYGVFVSVTLGRCLAGAFHDLRVRVGFVRENVADVPFFETSVSVGGFLKSPSVYLKHVPDANTGPWDVGQTLELLAVAAVLPRQVCQFLATPGVLKMMSPQLAKAWHGSVHSHQ